MWKEQNDAVFSLCSLQMKFESDIFVVSTNFIHVSGTIDFSFRHQMARFVELSLFCFQGV